MTLVLKFIWVCSKPFNDPMLGPDVALSQLCVNASPSGIILNNGSGAAIAVRITFHIINWILWVAKTYFYLSCTDWYKKMIIHFLMYHALTSFKGFKLKISFLSFLCSNLKAKNTFFGYWPRLMLARIRYFKWICLDWKITQIMSLCILSTGA